MRYPLSTLPLLLPTLALMAGISVSHLCDGSWLPAAIAAGVALILFPFRHLRPLSLLAIIAAVGSLSYSIDTPRIDDRTLGRTLCHTASIEITRPGSRSQLATLRTDADRPQRLLLVVTDFEPQLHTGYTITFHGEITPVEDRTDLPEEFSYSDYLRSDGIAAHVIIPSDSIISIIPTPGWVSRIKRYRIHVTDMILSSSLSTPTKEFLTTTLTGDNALLSPEVRERFSAAGIAHVLALSGLHIGMIAMFISMMLFPLCVIDHRRFRLSIVIVALWAFAILVGMPDSVTRAVIMFTVYTIGVMIRRRNFPINYLCLAAIVVLLMHPLSLFRAGFQLSFTAVLAILLFTKDFNPIRRLHHNLAYLSLSYVCVSVAAILGTALITAMHFHSLPLYFIPSNIVASLLLPFILGGGIMLIVFETIGYDPIWLCTGLDWLYLLLDHTAGLIGSIPGNTIHRIYLSWWMLIPVIATLAALKIWLVKRRQFWLGVTVTCGLATLLLGVVTNGQPVDDSRLYVGRRSDRTDLLIHDASHNRLHLLSTDNRNPNHLLHDNTSRYLEFMRHRGIDSINLIRPHDTGLPRWIRITGPVITVGHTRIALISADSTLHYGTRHVDYALVCRGYRDNIERVISNYSPDTILLSADLTPARLRRYAERCDSLRHPYRSLRSEPFSLSLSNSR